MKRWIAILLITVFASTIFSGCTNERSADALSNVTAPTATPETVNLTLDDAELPVSPAAETTQIPAPDTVTTEDYALAIVPAANTDDAFSSLRFTSTESPIQFEADAALTLTECTFAENAALPLITLAQSRASLQLNRCATQPAQMPLCNVTNGTLSLFASGATLHGNIVTDEASVLSLSLTDSTVYTGAFHAGHPSGITLSLTEDSIWNVTENTSIGVLITEDMTFSNIRSGGHTVYYDSSLQENAYLAEKSYVLEGNGFLVPLI